MRKPLQQAQIGACPAAVGNSRAEDELAYLLRLIHERQHQRLARQRAIAGHAHEGVVLLERNCGIRQLEGRHHRLDNRRQHRFRRQRHLQAMAKLREHRVRLVALPVDQAIYRALQTLTQWLHRHRHHARRQERDHCVAAYLEEDTGATDDKHIEDNHAQGQRAVDQRAIDQLIHVQEAVP